MITYPVSTKQAIELIKTEASVCQLSFSYPNYVICFLVLQDFKSSNVGVLGMKINSSEFVSLQKSKNDIESFVLASQAMRIAMRPSHKGENLMGEFKKIFSGINQPTNLQEYDTLLKSSKSLQEAFIRSKFSSDILDDLMLNLSNRSELKF